MNREYKVPFFSKDEMGRTRQIRQFLLGDNLKEEKIKVLEDGKLEVRSMITLLKSEKAEVETDFKKEMADQALSSIPEWSIKWSHWNIAQLRILEADLQELEEWDIDRKPVKS